MPKESKKGKKLHKWNYNLSIDLINMIYYIFISSKLKVQGVVGAGGAGGEFGFDGA